MTQMGPRLDVQMWATATTVNVLPSKGRLKSQNKVADMSTRAIALISGLGGACNQIVPER